MKTCGQCKTEKEFSAFHKRKASLDGYAATCKDCHKEYKKSYYLKNKDKIKKQLSDYYSSNKSKFIMYSRERRGYTSKATPDWLTEEHRQQIEDFYWLAKDLETVTGEPYHVDHIVPLKGKNVSGLHVPWNLQVLPADVNIRKGNSHES